MSQHQNPPPATFRVYAGLAKLFGILLFPAMSALLILTVAFEGFSIGSVVGALTGVASMVGLAFGCFKWAHALLTLNRNAALGFVIVAAAIPVIPAWISFASDLYLQGWTVVVATCALVLPLFASSLWNWKRLEANGLEIYPD